jgi:hypothetical protein
MNNNLACFISCFCIPTIQTYIQFWRQLSTLVVTNSPEPPTTCCNINSAAICPLRVSACLMRFLELIILPKQHSNGCLCNGNFCAFGAVEGGLLNTICMNFISLLSFIKGGWTGRHEQKFRHPRWKRLMLHTHTQLSVLRDFCMQPRNDSQTTSERRV